MQADKKKIARVHYRMFNRKSGFDCGRTLQELFRAALETTTVDGGTFGDSWTSRRFEVANSNGNYRFCHELEDGAAGLSGMLCLYSPEEYLAVIRAQQKEASNGEHESLAEALENIEIAERQPPEGEEILKSHAYFLVKDDHVFIVSSMALRPDSLQDYLFDFLKATGHMIESDAFELKAAFDPVALGADEKPRAIEIGGIVHRPPAETDTRIVEVDARSTLGQTRIFQQAYDVLAAVVGSLKADEIMAKVPPDANLEVDVSFSYRAKRKKLERVALDDLASAVRDLPDGQVKILGENSTVVNGEARLHMDMPFLRIRPNGALLNLGDVRSVLTKVYARFVEDGKIET